MNATSTAIAELFDRIPRRHTTDNVKEIYAIADEFEDILKTIESENSFYEKEVAIYFDELDTVRAGIKKSNDNKASKKTKDSLFDEASGNLKDSMQSLLEFYGDGGKTA